MAGLDGRGSAVRWTQDTRRQGEHSTSTNTINTSATTTKTTTTNATSTIIVL